MINLLQNKNLNWFHFMSWSILLT